MYICICNAVTEADIQASVAGGARTLSALQEDTGLASCCGSCSSEAQRVLDRHCPGPQACGRALDACVVPLVEAAPTVRWVSRVPLAHKAAAKAA